MATLSNNEVQSIGLDEDSLQILSFTTDVVSLLRILSTHDVEDERTYSSVSMFPIADGRELYIQPH